MTTNQSNEIDDKIEENKHDEQLMASEIYNTPTNQSNWESRFDEMFRFEGVVYKGQRHWKENVKQNLVKSFIRTLLKEEREETARKDNEKTFREIFAVMKEVTDLDGKIRAELLQKELLIEVFLDVDFDILKELNN